MQLVARFEHRHVADAGKHDELGVGQVTHDLLGQARWSQQVVGADDDERGHSDSGQLLSHVEVDQRPERLGDGPGRGRRHHGSRQLDVSGIGMAPETGARDQERGVARRQEPALGHPSQPGTAPTGGGHREASQRREPVRREQSACGGGDEHDPRHALPRHRRSFDAEPHDHHAAHRVADEHRVVDIEVLEHAREVADEVLEPVTLAPGCRATVAPEVDRDHAELVSEVDELVMPRRRGQREPVEQHDRTRVVRTALHHVGLAAVERGDDVGARIR